MQGIGLSVRAAVGVTFVVAVLAFGASPAWASYTAQVQAGTLQVVGNGASDKLAVRLQAGVPTVLELDVGDNGSADFTFDRSLFTGITVAAGSGNDLVRIDQANGAFTDESIVVDGGPGNDTLLGGNGGEIFIAGEGDDFVDGNRGDDIAFLGEDDDTFHWDPGDGNDTIEGQSGSDTLDFAGANVSEHFDVSANGGRVLFLRDVATIAMDINDVERIALHALGGTDTITANDLTGTDLTNFDVDLGTVGGGGDGQADTVVVNATAGVDHIGVASSKGKISVSGLQAVVGVTDSETAFDTVQVLGAAGNDTITTGAALPGSAAIVIDGGADLDTTQFLGSSKGDTISLAPNGAAVDLLVPGTPLVTATGESLVVRGLGGADTINAATALAGLTALTIDGGPGNDTLLGGNGFDILIGGDGKDFVDGNQNNDVAFLGRGNDTFHWDPGDGSDVVEGQDGKDLLDFAGANVGEHFDVFANGGRVLFLRDVAAIAMDMDDVERVALHALGGTDTITANDLTGTDLTNFDVDLAAFGGGGDGALDTVVVNGTAGEDKVKVTRSGSKVRVVGLALQTRITGSEPANDTLRVQTLAGNDSVTVATAVSALIQTIVDLGTDE
jgi:Ca2+-binding RTX toxin-like protein